MFKGKKVLVTGGAGFLGSYLAGELLKRNAEVYCIDDGTTGAIEKIQPYLKNKNFHFTSGTILDVGTMEKLIKECEVVYHFAAVVGVLFYVEDPLRVLNVNIKGTQIVLDLAYKYKRKVIFSSTSEVYGKNPKIPWSEDDDRVLGPTDINRWCYSTSKAANEHLCFAYYRMGMPVVIFRFFNVYGPRIDKLGSGRVISILAEQALSGKPITVVGDGRQTRCFTYVDDALKGIILASESEKAIGEVFNIGTDVETQIKDLAFMVKDILHTKSEVIFVDHKHVYGKSYEDVPRRVPDVSKARRILGFSATTPLKEGLTKTLNWFKVQYQGDLKKK
jgi:UDP-glucose 4-epimerase